MLCYRLTNNQHYIQNVKYTEISNGKLWSIVMHFVISLNPVGSFNVIYLRHPCKSHDWPSVGRFSHHLITSRQKESCVICVRLWLFTFIDCKHGTDCKQTGCKKMFCMNSQLIESFVICLWECLFPNVCMGDWQKTFKSGQPFWAPLLKILLHVVNISFNAVFFFNITL